MQLEDDEPAFATAFLDEDPLSAFVRLRQVPDRDSSNPVERALVRARGITDQAERVDYLRGVLDPLPQHTRLWYAVRFPAYMDDPLMGIPFDACVLANRPKAILYRTSADIMLRSWGVELAKHPAGSERYADVLKQIEVTTNDRAFYDGLLRPGRQVIYLNPTEKAGLIEVHGNLAHASRIAELVPGATTDHLMLPRITTGVDQFVAARPDGDLAGITFAPGNYPGYGGQPRLQTLIEAASPGYALQLAPKLVLFNEILARENAAPITVLGYSYGAVAAGTALTMGLRAEQAMFLDGAGSGVGVYGVDDYAASNPNLKVVVLTQDSDFTRLVAFAAPRLGVLPTHLRGAVFLDPKVHYTDDHPEPALRGTPLTGLRGHIDIALPGTSAFAGMMAVLSGGDYEYLTSYPSDRVSRLYDVHLNATKAVREAARVTSGLRTGARSIHGAVGGAARRIRVPFRGDAPAIDKHRRRG